VLLEMVPEQHRASCETPRATPHARPFEIAQEEDSLDDSFGSQISTKQKNVLRIGFQNIGGFPSRHNKLKDEVILQGLNLWEFDIIGFAEVNLDWHLVPEHLKLHTRTKTW
jgi:hypothetical protein